MPLTSASPIPPAKSNSKKLFFLDIDHKVSAIGWVVAGLFGIVAVWVTMMMTWDRQAKEQEVRDAVNYATRATATAYETKNPTPLSNYFEGAALKRVKEQIAEFGVENQDVVCHLKPIDNCIVSFQGNTAKASVTENWTYEYFKSNNPSKEAAEYEVYTLAKRQNGWKVTDVQP